MKPNKLTLVAAALICCLQLTAKPVKRPDSFNFQRGMEAWNAEQYAEALDYFNQELKDTPKSSYAYGMIAVIWNGEEEYGKALAAANAAVKYCPKKDAEWMGIVYSTRADIQACLEDTTAAIRDYTQAIKSDPKRYTYYNERGDLYFELKQYDLSDADFRMMLNSDKSEDVRNGLMGLGRNQLRQGNADKALPLFSRVIQMHTDDAVAYSWRAECYMEQAKFNEATDDLVTALRIDDDNKAFRLMQHLDNEQGFTLMRLKLKKEQGKNPNSGRWFYYEGRLCESNSRYHEAIEAYKQAGKIDAIAVEDDIADCYSDLGDYDKAMHYYELVMSNDSTNERIKLLYMDACGNSGNRAKAIGIANALIEQYPDVATFYNLRGWWESDNGQYAAAIEDFTMTVILDSTANEAYLNRGRCYIKTGQTGLARADFEKFITLSDEINNGSCGALAYLGRKDEALECMRKSVHKDSADYYYIAACVHSILNEKAPALQNLERALQLGFHRFAHIEVHLDFDNIRNTREFRTIVDKYRQKHL